MKNYKAGDQKYSVGQPIEWKTIGKNNKLNKHVEWETTRVSRTSYNKLR